MTRAVLWREIVLHVRTPALWFAMAVQVVVLTLLLLIWGDGVPAMTGSFAEQFVAVHSAVLAAVLPWVAARSPGVDRRDLAFVACHTSCAPRRIVFVKGFALALVLSATAASAVPHVVLAWRTSAEGDALLPMLATALALCAFVSASAIAMMVWGMGRFARWITVTGATVVALTFASGVVLAALLITAMAMMASAALSADQRLRFPAPSVFAETLP